jgi:predicted Zn-dependent protease
MNASARRRLRLCLTAALVGSGVAACAVNPVSGRPELSTMSAGREGAIGRRLAEAVVRGIGVVPDAALARYVEQVGARVAAGSPRTDVRYTFFVADVEDPNAFALPGGYIFVTRGMLALTSSEAELAGLLGHEIAHVAGRHAAQSEARLTGLTVLGSIGGLAARVFTGTSMRVEGAVYASALGALGDLAGAGILAAYSRGQEREADELGQTLAAGAGYDPRGIAAVLKVLQRDQSGRSARAELESFLASHPGTESRIRDTSNRAETLARNAGGAPLRATRDAYLGQLDGMAVGPDPRRGLFRGVRFLHLLSDYAIEVPERWRAAAQGDIVAAQPDGAGALLTVESSGAGTDPAAAARLFLSRTDATQVVQSDLSIHGMRAHRIEARIATDNGPAAAEWTWIAHPRAGMFRISALTTPDRYAAHAAELRSSALSFRALTPKERASVRMVRLRIVPAAAGETLADVSRRTRNVWTLARTANANAVAESAPLPAGFAVKVAVVEPADR